MNNKELIDFVRKISKCDFDKVSPLIKMEAIELLESINSVYKTTDEKNKICINLRRKKCMLQKNWFCDGLNKGCEFYGIWNTKR